MGPAVNCIHTGIKLTHLHDVGNRLEEASHLAVEGSHLSKLEQAESGSQSDLGPGIATDHELPHPV